MADVQRLGLGWPTFPGRPCSVAAALHVVGERWSLLAVREMLYGNSRFDVIARNTGAPRDRLSARLRELERAGVIERRRYSDRPPRYDYHLTEAGKDLASVLYALLRWGDRWLADRPPVTFEHSCGEPIELGWLCRRCGHEVTREEATLRVHTEGWQRPGDHPADAELA